MKGLVAHAPREPAAIEERAGAGSSRSYAAPCDRSSQLESGLHPFDSRLVFLPYSTHFHLSPLAPCFRVLLGRRMNHHPTHRRSRTGSVSLTVPPPPGALRTGHQPSRADPAVRLAAFHAQACCRSLVRKPQGSPEPGDGYDPAPATDSEPRLGHNRP